MRLALLAPLALAACMDAATGVDPLEPQVIDFNGSTVKIRHHAYAVGDDARSPIVAKANEICGAQSKRAKFGSFTKLSQFEGLHTYICV